MAFDVITRQARDTFIGRWDKRTDVGLMSEKRKTIVTPSGMLKQAAAWSFSLAYLPTLVATCSMISAERRSTVGPQMARGWGWTVARLAGVKIRHTAAARAALMTRKPRVLTFNHGSTIDVPLGASLLPDGGVLALKAEMREMPLLGAGCVALGSIFLERSNRDSAYATLQESSRRIQTERLQVLIAPEGTRAEDGQLGRFKLGAFHLAYEAKAPILPIVFHHAAEVWPREYLAPIGGTVTVDILPEFVLTDGTPDGFRGAADKLREDYQASLDAGPGRC